MIRAGAYLAGRYRLDGKIAVGGMGEVWRATDTVLDRPVAIKLPHQAGEAKAAAWFRAEARYVGSLSHAGIAQVYDYCEADRGFPPFLVMELVEGQSLATVLSAGPLGQRRTMNIVAQVAAALADAHAAGMVHMDIKPANLLVGSGDQVKIIDFGIARDAWSAEITGTGAVIGSPAYLPPERLRGVAATAASDLYSLGVVAYECLAGVPPFTGAGMEVASAHVHRPMPSLPPGVSDEIADFVAHLTAKNPADRPPGAAEVAEHAAFLRDSLSEDRTLRLPMAHPGWSRYSSSAGGTAAAEWGPSEAANGQHRAMLDSSALGSAPGRAAGGRRAEGRGPRRRVGAWLAAAAVAAVVALAGWQLTGALSAQPRQQAAGRQAARSQPATVTVVAAALTGQRVRDVRRELVQLGLRPRVTWQPSDKQEPGTVISVTPSGAVRPGTVVVVTVAARPHGHDRGNGGGGGGDATGRPFGARGPVGHGRG